MTMHEVSASAAVARENNRLAAGQAHHRAPACRQSQHAMAVAEQIAPLLEKKASFTRGVAELAAALQAASPDALPALYPLVARTSLLLKTRYASPGYFLPALSMFKDAYQAGLSGEQRAKVQQYIKDAEARLAEIDVEQEPPVQVDGSMSLADMLLSTASVPTAERQVVSKAKGAGWGAPGGLPTRTRAGLDGCRGVRELRYLTQLHGTCRLCHRSYFMHAMQPFALRLGMSRAALDCPPEQSVWCLGHPAGRPPTHPPP